MRDFVFCVLTLCPSPLVVDVARDQFANVLQAARYLERVQEERSKGDENGCPSERARNGRAIERRRNDYPPVQALLGAHHKRLPDEEGKAAAEARHLHRLQRRKYVNVESARGNESECACHPHWQPTRGERPKDGTVEQAMKQQVPPSRPKVRDARGAGERSIESHFRMESEAGKDAPKDAAEDAEKVINYPRLRIDLEGACDRYAYRASRQLRGEGSESVSYANGEHQPEECMPHI